jgi:peroxiredoxin
MDRQLAGVLCCGVLLAGVCTWRVWDNRPQSYAAQRAEAQLTQPAFSFVGLDQHNELFRLARYLHRHEVLVLFVDARTPAGAALRDQVWRAVAAGVWSNRQVVVVSPQLPAEHRQWDRRDRPFPCPVVSDVTGEIRRAWPTAMNAAYLVNRKGEVACVGQRPVPLSLADYGGVGLGS